MKIICNVDQFQSLEESVFFSNFRNIIDEGNLFDLFEVSDGQCDITETVYELYSNFFDTDLTSQVFTLEAFRGELESVYGVGKERRLVVAPTSLLFDEINLALADEFENIIFIDNGRAGKIRDHEICKLADFTHKDGDYCVMPTRNPSACAYYERLFGPENTLNIFRIKRIDEAICDREKIDRFIGLMAKEEKPLLLYSVYPLQTLSSSLSALKERGFTPFWAGAKEIKNDSQSSYHVPKVSDFPVSEYVITNLGEAIYLLAHTKKGANILNWEPLFPPAWDFKRVSICYAVCRALIATVKQLRSETPSSDIENSTNFPTLLFMYDAIKPGVKNYDCAQFAGPQYKSMLREADGVIFSSYHEEFREFVENSMGQSINAVTTFRHHVVPEVRKIKDPKEFHIAFASVFLEEFWEPSREGLSPYIRYLAEQGVHIHYYASDVNHYKLKEFAASLAGDKKRYFHVHPVIFDPEELAIELSQYHAGWCIFNLQIFNEMTVRVNDQFTRDAMEMFVCTTLASVVWTAVASGLPVIHNRSQRAVIEKLPKGMSIPVNLSEVPSIPKILKKIDWDAVGKIDLGAVDINKTIDVMADFLDQYYGRGR